MRQCAAAVLCRQHDVACFSQAVQRRRLRDLLAYKLPGQTNRVALLFNPLDDYGIPFTFGLEVQLVCLSVLVLAANRPPSHNFISKLSS